MASVSRRQFLAAGLAAAASAGLSAGQARADGAQVRRKRLLVLGGTHFLGPAFVEAARARGHAITLFNRGRSHPELFPDVEKLVGDRDGKLDALKGRTFDAVLDTSGYVPRHVRDSATLLAGAVERYLFVSTISVYADMSRPVDESSPVGQLKAPTESISDGAYGPLKALCESAAEEAMPGRVCVVRPGLIVGPRDATDRFTYWPVRLARGGEVLAPGAPTDPVLYIDVRDLAQWMVLLLERGTTGTFNALGPAGRFGIGDLVEGCRKAVGGDAKVTWVDASFLEKHDVRGWTDLPVWTPSTGPTAFMGRISRSRAVAAGLTFRPIAETARDTVAWWRTLPEERRTRPVNGLAPDAERKVLQAWHERT
jgi:2'-hydroxyisoflavone reductase